MKKLWLAAVAGLALSSSVAFAADLGTAPMYKAPPAPPPPPSWTGFYIGVNGGYGWSQRTGDIFCPGGGVCNIVNGSLLRPEGGLVGGQIGYNWETDNLVVWGFEADGQWADIHKSATAFVGPGGVDTLNVDAKLDWFGTARVRLGLTPWNNWLIYVTGGLIYGGVKASGSVDIPGPRGGFFSASGSTTRTGGTAGGGIEYAFTPNFTGRIEGLWYDMGSHDVFLPALDETAHGHLTGAIVRAGLNWRVNWFGGPGSYAPQ